MNLDATTMLGDHPAPGFQDVLINLTMTYQGSGSSHDYSTGSGKVVGASNIAYNGNSAPSSCHVPIPNYLPSSIEQFTGSSLTGNRCFSVPVGDVASLELYFDSNDPAGDTRVWFALH